MNVFSKVSLNMFALNALFTLKNSPFSSCANGAIQSAFTLVRHSHALLHSTKLLHLCFHYSFRENLQLLQF